MPDTVTLFAPAKLNLYLHVTGKREDGYHLLDSLVGFADLGDTVALTPARAPSFRIEGPFAGPLRAEDPKRNLVFRAVRVLAAELGREPALDIVLTKRLPVASGIGGGSADAAAALRGAGRLWDVAEDDPRLYAIARTLGADVPVCLRGRAGYFAGTGEELSDAPALPPVWLVLVNPGKGLETKEVFQARAGGFSRPHRLDRAPADAAEFASMLARRHNDLAPPALSLMPEIGRVLDALSASPFCLLSRMSGSGATCFGLYGREVEAHAAAGAVKAAHPGWWVAAAKLLP